MKRESTLALRHDDEIVEQTSEGNVDVSEKHEENEELNNFELAAVKNIIKF